MQEPDINAQLRQLYASIEAANSEGLTDIALDRCERALKLLAENGDDAEEYTMGDFLLMAGHANWAAGDLEEAQRNYRQSLELEPDNVDAALAVGVTLFHLARFEAARAQLEVVSAEDPEYAEAWYYLALLALRRDDRALADNFFQRANEIEPERWSIPLALSSEEIAGILESYLDEMPAELREALSNVPVILEERPSESMLYSNDPPLDPLLLGYFEGTPLPEHSVFAADVAPARIMIFSENISLLAADREKLQEELWITLKHEIGHYFGLDEDELAARGLA
jgi:predicted Zn-dependent protease with MMP-like domain